jgi:alpha-amylase
MLRLTLGLALHNHQPVGNFGSVFEQAYRRAYEPMVGALERHPGVRLALHYSGPVMDWLAANEPGLLSRIRALVARRQVEIMTGGYYEPILPIIPDRDKRGQIAKMTMAVRALFGYDATGLWLAERVWEPHLPRILAATGVAYTIVDDAHFHRVGVADAELYGHYVTEEQGATVAIFPSSKGLRYRIPWWQVPELMQWLRQQAADDDRLLLMGDDGEKFGLWPGTHVLCWERGWIDEFFSALQDAREWLSVVPPGEWVRGRLARGRIYLPTASYDEMTEWALPAPSAARLPAIKHELEAQGRTDLLPFLQGGYWRHFLVKYPEINTLHKAMLRVSRKVWRMRPGPRRDEALDHLWQGQCNCPYWHGVFGGIYLGHIRAANYAHLIEAEHLADLAHHARRGRPWIDVETSDLDADGRPEVLVSTDTQVLTIDPDEGGSLVAWDFRHARVNLVNVMTRRAEGYHETLRAAVARGEVVLTRPDVVETIHTDRVRVKEWGLERHLGIDPYRRTSFRERFLSPGTDPTVLGHAHAATHVGGDLPYAVKIERTRSGIVVRLARRVHLPAGGESTILARKSYVVSPGPVTLDVIYRVENESAQALASDLAIETNWGMSSPDAQAIAGGTVHRVGAEARVDGVEAVVLRDPALGVPVAIEVPACRLWMAPIFVVSASEAGFERTFQGTTLVFVWPLRLDPGGVWEGRIVTTPGDRLHRSPSPA